MHVDVSVIIVSYNARELLDDCIQSVLAEQSPQLQLEPIVVDNDSSDDSVAWVRERFPNSVRVIETGHNGGMGAGNNAGMLHARGRHFLLLNSDARLRPGSLSAMVRAAEGDSRIGLVGPRLLNPDGSLQRSVRGFPTTWRLVTEFFYLRRLAPTSSMFNSFYAGGFAHDAPRDVEWVSGACMLVSRAAVADVGLMDEAFFMFNEESDWQLRMERHGWRRRFEPAAEVEHLGGGSTAKQWGAMYAVQVCSHVRYLARNHGIGAARRARWLLRTSLLQRAGVYSAAAAAVARRSSSLRARAGTFSGARRALRELDLATSAERSIPEWKPVEQIPVSSR